MEGDIVMNMRSGICITGMAVVVFACLFAAGSAAGGPNRSSESLTLVDLDGSKIQMSLEDLRKLPQEIEEECICVGHSAGFIGIFDYSGVRLSEILEKAKAAKGANEYKQENIYVVFRGTDGYQVIASWTELTQTAEGKRILIALDKDAQPLPPLEGKLRLVLPGDKWVGRSVKCLETIEIRCAEGVVEKKKG
jgi:DMSO/TMAO reductase YedYZ molybdopterin-dependent catalytic subunit